MKNKNTFDVDFVVLWVDCNDESWQKERSRYTPDDASDVSAARYQNWDNFQYWFRAVERFAPWVRKVHLVTNGQTPEWLNLNHPKLHLVSHADYIPEDALPLFNSNGIEVGIHKIAGLAEHFVYFNDDMFITKKISADYFFKNGLPKENYGLVRKTARTSIFSNAMHNNLDIINKHFDFRTCIRKYWSRWLNPMNGKMFLRTLLNLKHDAFPGFVMPHLSTAYIKRNFEAVWDKESSVLQQTQHNRFRSEKDVTHFLFRNWRTCSGDCAPSAIRGKYFRIADEASAKKAAVAILRGTYPEICINEVCTGSAFENVKTVINSAFAQKLSKKSSFEL